MSNFSKIPEAKKVASFDLDHTRVRAPYVRLAGHYTGPSGDVVSKFDLRLVQPNVKPRFRPRRSTPSNTFWQATCAGRSVSPLS